MFAFLCATILVNKDVYIALIDKTSLTRYLLYPEMLRYSWQDANHREHYWL